MAQAKDFWDVAECGQTWLKQFAFRVAETTETSATKLRGVDQGLAASFDSDPGDLQPHHFAANKTEPRVESSRAFATTFGSTLQRSVHETDPPQT